MSMGFTIEDSAIQPVRSESRLPVLPREEARRYRQAAREMADVAMPRAMERLLGMLEAEDDKVAMEAIKQLVKLSMSGRSNEDLDPHEIVDGKVLGRDPVKDLEESTEKTGEDAGEGS